MSKKSSIEQRLKEAEKVAGASRKNTLELANFLFPKQLEALQDPSPFKLFLCSRRAGKSSGIAADLVKTAVETENCTSLYITGARTDAKKIMWAAVKKFNEDEGYGGVPNESELTLTIPNGSVVRLAGAKDDASIDKIRGQMPPIKKAYIDEAQLIRDRLLRILVDDVIEPALLDLDGCLVLAGTPPPVPAGYFIDAFKSPSWKTFQWTFFDNPFMASKSKKTHQQLLDRVLKRRGVTIDDPAIRREYFGELAVDTNSLVFRYNALLNDFTTLPAGMYTYILGVDVGFNDADAIAVLAWSEDSKITYLVEELITPKQGVTELAEQIKALQLKYDISKIVMDTGGLGKKVAEEIIRRHGIHIQAADKVRKFENIELMNDAMRTGQLLARANSTFATDCLKVEWDLDKMRPDRKVVSDRFHSDICDAVLYAWRESYAFAHTPVKPKAAWGTPNWHAEEQERMEEEAQAFFEAQEAASKDPYS